MTQNTYIIIISIIVIIISLFYPYFTKNIVEGLGEPSVDSIKPDQGVSEIELQDKLTKLYSNVREHERRLALLDNSYKKDNIQQNPRQNIAKNARRLLQKIKKQDEQLVKLTKNGNRYIPSNSLDGLINGSLLLPYYNELMKVHKYKKKPIMGPPSTNPAKLLKFEQIYNRNGYPDDGKDARKAAVEYRYGIKEKPDNTPIISRKAVNNLVQDAMIKYIDEIVMYQNNALVEYEKSLESAITGMYVSH